MRVGEDLLADCFGARVFAVVLRKGDVEALRAGEAVAFGVDVEVVFLGALHIRHEGEQQASVVGRVLTQGELAVDLDVVNRGEGAVFVHQAIGAGRKVLEIVGGPPVVEVTFGVELAAFVVETVGKFVADDGADVTVVDGDVLGGIVERRLQDSGGEVDIVHAGVVVRVDGGRRHLPLILVDGLADFVEFAVVLEGLCGELVAQGVVGFDDELGVVAPLVGVADFVRDGGELLVRAGFGGGGHPVDLVDVSAHGGLDIVDHLQRFCLAVAGEVILVDVDFAERLAQRRVGVGGAAFPARFLLILAVEDAAIEVEVLGVEWLRQIGGDRCEQVVAQVSLDGGEVRRLHLARQPRPEVWRGVVDFGDTRRVEGVFVGGEVEARQAGGEGGDGLQVIGLLGLAHIDVAERDLRQGCLQGQDVLGVMLGLLRCTAGEGEHFGDVSDVVGAELYVLFFCAQVVVAPGDEAVHTRRRRSA